MFSTKGISRGRLVASHLFKSAIKNYTIMIIVKWILSRYEKKDELSRLVIERYRNNINNLVEATGL